MPIPPPPVPQRLREMLKDYPDLIERLQADLTYVANAKRRGTPLFERAVWMLEDALGGFISEAREELQAAEASADEAAMEHARRKEQLLLTCSSKYRWIADEEFNRYFEHYGRAFE
ncbi:hypothetical protein ACFOED_11675 [Vulcaniibacterium thermophilum]|jgi:hypothetical protein|uniref:Uncharacterized protein n=1 Tax=Vulcaniibacterium thermophilum TaxID=1169913 RepID=A0A918Z8K3_9GAMM|nr:hypothetical protein [Vulcaniibacterium thermophilum]GHE40662.1 hypothetical protein GCM10007167_23380 [Vulcaniibacterium thermophilum]